MRTTCGCAISAPRTCMLDLHHQICITQFACTERATGMQYRALLEDCQGEVVLKEMEIEGLKRKLCEVEKNVKA